INQYDENGARQYSDTVVNNESTNITIPSFLQFGISFDKPTPKGIHKKSRKVKTSVWSIAFDFSQYNWSEYRNPVDLFSYSNAYSMKLGGEICPDIAQRRSKSFASQMFFRGGFYYEQAPHVIDGQLLETVGVNAGVGLPMYGAKQLPRYINFMVGYGLRGLHKDILIRESYFNFAISVSFNNKFAKRKAGL
ncbi:hypothetical protein OAH12_03095, partial [Cyclobacteriaceae bacterium]|nr:hypothetical protein [Cyclobacteriaceae bacterium]